MLSQFYLNNFFAQWKYQPQCICASHGTYQLPFKIWVCINVYILQLSRSLKKCMLSSVR